MLPDTDIQDFVQRFFERENAAPPRGDNPKLIMLPCGYEKTEQSLRVFVFIAAGGPDLYVPPDVKIRIAFKWPDIDQWLSKH